MAKGIVLQPQASNPLGVGEKGIWVNNANEQIFETGSGSINVSGSIASPRQVAINILNDSGAQRYKAEPISSNATGGMSVTDVSLQASSLAFLGVLKTDTANGVVGDVITCGRLENISGSFAFGDSLYVSKAGLLQNTYPDIGVDGFVSGDYVIRVGVITKNQTNPLQKDLIVCMQIIGQLA